MCKESMDHVKHDGAVALEPFVHQVGGHNSMMKFDEYTVCKPLISRERYFYESLPNDIRRFTPQFRGLVQVTLEESRDGSINFVAHPMHKKVQDSGTNSPGSGGEGAESGEDSDCDNTENNTKRQSKTKWREDHSKKSCNRVHLLRSGSLEVERPCYNTFEDHTENSRRSRSAHNPWSLHCYKLEAAKMRKNNKLHKFILLENLASEFLYPCVLDLKMGTRVHGDDASQEKKERQIAKCAATTSSSLGFRLCGMQVYRQDLGKYLCRNKYHGRSLTPDDVKQAFCEFLYNGVRLRTDVISDIISKLLELRHIVEKKNSFRFYSSSLLVMYEGKQHKNTDGSWTQDVQPKLDIRMIDFAHSTHNGLRGDGKTHSGPDTGYIYGLDNVIRIFQEIERGEKEG
ncbi:inositol hexakisphosphate kinase 1-like [Glandiceps talaboti]